MIHILNSVEGVATVAIAVYVASVGTVQWLTARDKLRLDLYNRRFDIYVSCADFIQALIFWQEVPSEEKMGKRIAFIRAVRESRFLFADDPSVLKLLEEVNVRSFKVTGFIDVLSQWAAQMPQEYVDAYYVKQDNLEWIMESQSKLEELLDPYLAFRHREMRRRLLWRRKRKGGAK